jgi:hypothetical protein
MTITLELSEGEARWLIWLINQTSSTCGTSRDIITALKAQLPACAP